MLIYTILTTYTKFYPTHLYINVDNRAIIHTTQPLRSTLTSS